MNFRGRQLVFTIVISYEQVGDTFECSIRRALMAVVPGGTYVLLNYHMFI